MSQIFIASSHFNISPRKMDIVLRAIKNLSLIKTMELLPFITKKGATLLWKILRSAIANSSNKIEDLEIKEIRLGRGKSKKKVIFRAKGRRDLLENRTTIIKVLLQKKRKLQEELKIN